MWEKAKSGLLVVLILLSFQLTGMLWSQVRAPSTLVVSNGGTTVTEVPQGSYLDLYAPLFIYAHDGSTHYQLSVTDSQYQDVWRKLQAVATKIVAPASAETVSLSSVGLDAWQRATRNGLEFRFAGQVELNFWWLAASKATLHNFPVSPLFFDRIVIPLDGDAIFFRNLQTNQVWQWQWRTERDAALVPANTLFAAIKDLGLTSEQRVRQVAVPDGVAVSPADALWVERRLSTLPEVLATVGFGEADRASIVKQFFSITPRVTKVENTAEGVAIESYITAKQQVLRLYNSGLIEFSDPVKQSGTNWTGITEQFEQALSFIGAHGGWPSSIISAGIRQVGSNKEPSYQFNFVHMYGGYPLVNVLPSTLSVQMTPQGVSSFVRKTYRVLQNGYFRYDVRTPEDALGVAAAGLNGRSITDIYLGYFQRQDITYDPEQPFVCPPMYLYPVWVVELDDGQHLLVHAFQLQNDPGVIGK